MDWYIWLMLIITILVIIKIYIKYTTGWCKSNVCLVGKTAIITGANSGLGYETAADFAKRGARVILACRDPSRGNTAREKIIAETNNPNIVFKQLDLASFKSVRQFCEDIKSSEERLDILVNNAGVCMIQDKTEDGLLVLMQTNYFGPFLLTNLLLDILKSSPKSRIINVSSISAIMPSGLRIDDLNNIPKTGFKIPIFSSITHGMLYARSKICLILFTMELAKRLKDTSVKTYSLHPGIIQTEIFRGFSFAGKLIWYLIIFPWCKDIVEGIQTMIYCSVANDIEELSGEHFAECQVSFRYLNVRKPELAIELWEMSEKIVGLN